MAPHPPGCYYVYPKYKYSLNKTTLSSEAWSPIIAAGLCDVSYVIMAAQTVGHMQEFNPDSETVKAYLKRFQPFQCQYHSRGQVSTYLADCGGL